MSGRIALSAAGETRAGWCERCLTSGMLVTTMYGLEDAGPAPLGVIEECACGVGPQWRCAYCDRVLPADGTQIFMHILAGHGEPADRPGGTHS